MTVTVQSFAHENNNAFIGGGGGGGGRCDRGVFCILIVWGMKTFDYLSPHVDERNILT